MSLKTSLRALLGTKSTRSPKHRQGTRRSLAGWNRSILGFESLEDRLTPDSGGAYGTLASGVVALNPSGNPVGGLPQVIPNIKIEPIFITDPTNAVAGSNVPTPMKPQLLPFLNTYATTGLIPSLLTQYNVAGLTIGNGTVGVTDIVSHAPDDSSAGVPCYSDALIQTIIQNEITAGRTGPSDGLNEFYVVFTPLGEGVTAPGLGSSTGGGFFAYHSGFQDVSGKVDYYTPIPDETLPGPNANLAFLGASAFQSETQTISHELTEGIADAIVPSGNIGWYSASSGNEISDQADNNGYFYNGYFMQNTWSNALSTDAQLLGTGTNNLLIDQLTPPAVTGVQPVQVATFTSGDTSLTASNFYAQVYDTVTDPGIPPDPSLYWSNITITGSNGHFVITATPPAGSVVAGGGDGAGGEYGTPFAQNGFTVVVTTSPYNLVNPSGNAPIAILQHPYNIAASAPLTYDANSGSGVNKFSLQEVGTNYQLTDNGLVVFTQPISKTTGINIYADPAVPGDAAASVNDSLSITGSLGQPVTFDGGPASLPHGSVGNPYNHTLPFVSGVTYTTPFTVGNFNAGGTGLVIGDITTNAGAGTVTVSGTPTGLGTATFTVTGTDTLGDTITRDYSIIITTNPPIVVSPSSLPSPLLNQSYSQTVTASIPSGAVPPYTYSVSAGSLPANLTLNPSTGVISGTATVTGVFNFTITATDTVGASGSTSYSFNILSPISATAVGSTFTYGQGVPLSATITEAGAPATVTGTVTFTYNGSPLGAPIPVTNGTIPTFTTGLTALPAGDDTITATYSGNSTYTSATTTFTVTVNQADLIVTADDQTMTYGGIVPALTYTQTGLVAGDSITGSLAFDTPVTSASPVGAYNINQGTLQASNNYNLTFTDGTLTVDSATLMIAPTGATVNYGAAIPTLGFTVESGLVLGQTASVITGQLTTTATSTVPVGSYSISLGTLAAPNYQIMLDPAAPGVTIDPAPLSVFANNVSVLYGSTFPSTLTYTTQGLVNGDTAQSVLSVSLTTTALPADGVGSYPITPVTLNLSNTNYTLSFTPGTFSITPAHLTITANNQTAQNDGGIPPLTYTVTGLVNADLPGVVTGLTLATTATAFSVPGQYPITISGGQAANYTLTLVGGTLTITQSTRLVGSNETLVGSNDGSGTAILYNADGVAMHTFTPFPGFTGAIRTAVADFNGDGTPDLAFGTGPGILAQFEVLDGKTFKPLLFDTIPFQGFFGGLYMATGDIDGDGTNQLVVTPDQGGGPRVEIYHFGVGTPIADFYGISDPNFRGGARSAVGDINHDGHADLVVAAGAGGGARVVVYDGASLAQNRLKTLVGDFFAFPDVLRNGVYVAVGDVNGDGYGDLIIGAGPGGGPNVLVLNGQTLINQGSQSALANPIANFFAGDTTNRDGVPVSAEHLTGGGYADVVTGQGGGGTTVTAYSGQALAAGNLDILSTFSPFNDSTGGVYVG